MVTLEERIVRFCAPVLTGIKTGGLFNTCELDPHTICQDTVAVRKRLSRFSINVRLFFTGEKMPLVYVYRPDALARDLADPETQAFLTPLAIRIFPIRQRCHSWRNVCISTMVFHTRSAFFSRTRWMMSRALCSSVLSVQSSQGTGACSTTRSRRRSALQRTTTAGRYVSPVIGKGSLLKRWPAQSDRRKEMHISESCDCILERHW